MDQLHGSVREVHSVEVAVLCRILIGIICCRDDRSLFIQKRDNSGANGIRNDQRDLLTGRKIIEINARADPHDTLLPRICFIEQKIAENGILGAVGPLVVHIGEISGFQIIDCVTVPLRVRISLTISPEWKFIEHFVGFLSRVFIIIMADRQEITPVGKKMDSCDDGRNGRAAHGLTAGRGDFVEMSDSVLLIPFFSFGAGCGKEQGIIRCPCPCFRVTAGCDPGNRFSFQIIQVQVRQISVGSKVRYGDCEGDLCPIG